MISYLGIATIPSWFLHHIHMALWPLMTGRYVGPNPYNADKNSNVFKRDGSKILYSSAQILVQMDFNKEFEDDLKIVKQFSFLSWPNDDECSCTFSPELSGLYNLVRRSNDNHRPWPLIMLFVSVYLKSKCCVANRFAQSIILTNRKTDVGFWFLWVLIKTQTEDKHDVTQLIAQKAQSQ